MECAPALARARYVFVVCACVRACMRGGGTWTAECTMRRCFTKLWRSWWRLRVGISLHMHA